MNIAKRDEEPYEILSTDTAKNHDFAETRGIIHIQSRVKNQNLYIRDITRESSKRKKKERKKFRIDNSNSAKDTHTQKDHD